MKKILKLQCNTCYRTIDKIVNLSRYETDKCNITLGCVGRLSPVEYKSSADIAVAPEIGITDWRPRGSKEDEAIELKNANFINLATGSSNQITLAVFTDEFVKEISIPISVVGNTPKAFRQYSFVKEQNFSIISGVETGLEKKTLRFDTLDLNPDQIEVYINGVRQEEGTDLNQYTVGNNASYSLVPINTIKFNSEIKLSGRTQVDVVVSKASLEETKYLKFVKNEDNSVRSGAWEDISFIEKLNENNGKWEKLFLFTCDVSKIADINLNSHFKLGVALTSNTTLIPLSSAYFLLANKPFSKLDRNHNVLVPLRTVSDTDHLKYYAESNEKVVKIVSSAIEEVYPLLKTPLSSKMDGNVRIKTQIAGNSEINNVNSKIIVGPDE